MAAATGPGPSEPSRIFLRFFVPVLCRYRPNRSHARVFTKSDAARVVCAVITAKNRGARIASGAVIGGGRTPPNLFGTVCATDRDLQDVLRLVELKCGREGGSRQAGEELQQAAIDSFSVDAISALEANNAQLFANSTEWVQVLEWLSTLIVFLSAAISVMRFVPIPAVRALAVGAGFVLRRVEGFQTAIIRRKATNDATWAGTERIIAILKAKAA